MHKQQWKFGLRFNTIMVLVLSAVCLMGIGCREKAPEQREVVQPAKTIVVGGDANIVRRQFAGVVRAKENAELAFRVPGQLKELTVLAGQKYKKGDLLAELDARDYQVQAELAESSLKGQKAQMALLRAGARDEDLVKLEAQAASAKSSFSAAQAQFERYEKLYEKGDIGKADYDAQKNARDAAKAQLATAEKSLEIGRTGARKEDLAIQSANIGGASAQLRSAKDAVEYTQLRAPFDGIVGQTFANSFEEVQAKQKVLTFQDLTQLKIDVDVPEDAMLSVNQYERLKLVAVFEGLPGREFPLVKDEINTDADPATRTYRVTLAMTPPDDVRILPGMSATVILDVKMKGGDDAPYFNIPIAAVVAVKAKAPYVWVADAKTMKVKKVPVKVGQISGDSIQILEGLKPGQIVVASGASFLKEGQRIKRYNPEKKDAEGGGK